MTEYDYSPEAYERFLATQNRIARWVDETEQHRGQFQPAVNAAHVPQQHPHRLHKEPSRRRRPSLHIQPPQSDSASSSDSEPIPPMPGVMYPAQPQPRYPGPIPPQPLLSPPPMMQMVYPNTQRSPYHTYPTTNHHHRSPTHSHSHARSPHHSPTYYSMGPSPQVSPAYSHHPQQQFVYPHPAPNPHPPLGYLVVHPPKQHHQPVVYLRA